MSAPFHDIAFPLALTIGARGGPERVSDVAVLASGAEVRNARWSTSRRRWTLSSGVTSLERLAELTAFFEARGGRLHAFRFCDFADHSSRAGDPTAADQVLGTGDGVRRDFQLMKDYGGHARTITKPVEGSVRVGVGGMEVTAFSVDHLTGIVTLDVSPDMGAPVNAGFEFDCAVRFDTDRIETRLEAEGAGRIIGVDLIEVRA